MKLDEGSLEKKESEWYWSSVQVTLGHMTYSEHKHVSDLGEEAGVNLNRRNRGLSFGFTLCKRKVFSIFSLQIMLPYYIIIWRLKAIAPFICAHPHCAA